MPPMHFIKQFNFSQKFKMWLPLLLFVLLSPGLLFKLGRGIESVFIHAAIFAACLIAARMFFQGVRIEGFEDKHVEGWNLGDSCGKEYCMYPKVYCKQREDGVKYCTETK
jgi:hypothetical protein